jgi:hypothetical protein
LLPYRKKSDAKADYKALKKDKNAKMSNTVAGELKAGKSPEEVIFEIQKGGGTPDSVGSELIGYFEGLATKLQVKQGKMEEEEADEAETAEKPATKISDTAKPTDKVNEAKPAKPLPKEEKNAQQKAIMEELITSCKLVYADIAKLKAEKDKAKKEKIIVVMFKKLDAWLKNYEAHRNDFPTHAKLEEAYAGLTEVWEAITEKKRAPMPDLAPEAEDATKEEPKKEESLDAKILQAAKEAIQRANNALKNSDRPAMNISPEQVLAALKKNPDSKFTRVIARNYNIARNGSAVDPKLMQAAITFLKLDALAKQYGLE